MWTERYEEKRKQGLEHLTGGNTYRYYYNERMTDDGQFEYDVIEFVGKPTDSAIKVALIGEQYTLEDEVKMLRKVVATLLSVANVDGDAVEAFLGYDRKVTEITNAVDSIGKVIQTLEGNGSMEDPYKGWKVGMSVEEGCWYLTEDGYLWEAIASGVPVSTTDRDYFDVVGV